MPQPKPPTAPKPAQARRSPSVPAVYKPQGAALPVQRKMAPAVRPMPPRPVSPPVVQRALAVVAPVVAAPAVATLAMGAVALAAVAGVGYLGYRYMYPAKEKPKPKVEPPVNQGKAGKQGKAPKAAAVRRAPAPASVVKVPTAAELAAAKASQDNRAKQLADNDLKKKAAAAAGVLKLAEDKKREDAAEVVRQTQRDREAASAEANRLAKAQYHAAEALRYAGIEQQVAAFAAGGLRATACNSIEQDQKRRGLANAASAQIALQAALDAQEIPSLAQWQGALGLHGLAPNGYRLYYHNGNAVDFTARAGHRIHITFSADSIRAGTSVGGRTGVQVMDSLLKSVTRLKRIHATEENTSPVNHFYYGDVVHAATPGMQELSDALDDYVALALMPAVQSAINRHGDI